MDPDPSPRFEATAMPDADWWQALWPDPTAVLTAVGIRSGLRAIDLCSGDGYFTIPMAALVRDGHVTAVELVDDLIDRATRAAEAAGAHNITFVQGDAMELPTLVSDPVDVVLIANTFHGAPDHTGLARAVRGTLKPDGSFVGINWWPRPREETTVLGKPRGPRPDLRFSPAQVATWVEPAGFELTDVMDVGPYHYGAIFSVASLVPSSGGRPRLR